MVLQRDKPVRIWGWAAPGEKVTIFFRGESLLTVADQKGAWAATLMAKPASRDPQNLVAKGKDKTITLENILVGDVWVLGGQSNMEFALAKVDDGAMEIASANYPEIRLLTVPQGKGFEAVKSFEGLYEYSSWSSRHFRKGYWEVCTPETVKEFSAIGYVFGRRVHKASEVPIGLIDASRGGTTVETWTPEDVMKQIKGEETQAKLAEWNEKIAAYDAKADLEGRIKNFERKKEKAEKDGKPLPAGSKPPSDLRPGPKADHNRPGYCYAGMISPMEGLSVKGAVFHQGYNNCFAGSAGARMYGQVFGKMITSWRAAFNDPTLPFCIISLCSAGDPQTGKNFLKPMNDVGPLIREAQYQTFLNFQEAGDKTSGFASSYDFRKSWYHPQIKVPVGERAAKWAMATQYGVLSDEFWLPPSIEKMEAVDGALQLKMSTNVTTKDDSDGRMIGFAIAGEDRRFYPAEVNYATDGVDNRNRPKQIRNTLVISSPHVTKPIHYRYAWARNPMANIVSSRQIPIATQRSDDWALEETPISFPVPEGMDEVAKRRYLSGRIRKELELGDTERQIQDAEATLAELKEKFLKDKAAWEASKAKELAKMKEGK
jgi:sialate O-acetylesterase